MHRPLYPSIRDLKPPRPVGICQLDRSARSALDDRQLESLACSEDYAIWLAKRRQLVKYGLRGLLADARLETIGEVLRCDSTSFKPVRSDEEEDRSGCAWRDCESHGKEPEPNRAVKLSTCRGCGEAQNCGRACQRMCVRR